ncbi:MAG UNVERIFIED_CONTAM: WD40 repeat domain-containing protein [Planctomycetaceae bacterium]
MGKGVAVDIVMSDVRHQETPAALIETSQRIAAYSYFPQTGQLINSLLGDSDGLITCLELQKNWGDHERVVVGSKNGKARVWQREPGRFLTPSLALSGTPLLVDFSAPGPDFLHPFVSVTDDGEISYWNLHTNALRETLDEGVISRQRLYVHSGRSDTAKWRLLSQSPDESCGISVSEDSTFRGYVQLEFNLSPELTSVIDAGISVEKVLWSHDSRYAVLIEGQSPVDEQGASSLLQNEFLNSRAGRSTSVPVQSRLAIIDLETRRSIGPHRVLRWANY